MPTVAEIIGDPDFAKLSAHDRVSALRKLKGPEIAAAYFDTIPPSEMMGTVPGEDNEQITPEVANTRAMTGLGVASLAAGAVPFAAHGLMGGLAATGASVVGAGLGAKAGRFVGSGVDEATGGLTQGYGAQVGGVVGGLVGGGYAGVKGPAALGTLLKFAPHGGPLASVARAMLPEVDAALSARIAHTLTREAPAAVEAAGEAVTASRMAPGASQAARALEGAGLSPELATAEAGKMASATGEVSGNLPGVMTSARGTPALKMPAVAWSQDIQSQVATLRAAGESKAQIIQTLRETYGHKNLPADATEEIVDMIFETGSRVPATAEALPAGRKLAPPYRGGKGLPYTGTPPPRNDAELNQRLRESLDAYKIP